MFERMLVPLDGSPLAECVLPHVVAMASPLGAKVTLLHVCEPLGVDGAVHPFNGVAWQLKTAEAEAYVEGIASRLREAGLTVESRCREGRAAEQIVAYAHQQNCNLIMLSSHGRSGLTGWNVSSTVQKIVARARVSVMIVRAYQPAAADLRELSYSQLMCPLDCSQRAEHILPVAVALARAHGARVLLAHVATQPEIPRRRPCTEEELELIHRLAELNRSEAERCLEDVRTKLLAEHVDATSHVMLSDDPTRTLHDWIEEREIDLVLMSAHGYTGSTRWPYGRVALNFVVYGSTPLLISQDLSVEQIGLTAAETLAGESVGY